jgi:prevent-host-death family protein
MTESIGVAEAKRRFSELIERVRAGERFVVTRRGRPVLALVSAAEHVARKPRPVGLAALSGALANWKELDEVVEEIYAARRRARDREVPDLD